MISTRCVRDIFNKLLEAGDPEILLQSVMRVFKFLPDHDRQVFFEQVSGKALNEARQPEEDAHQVVA